jgi:mannose-6-phosphate isomerase-like protein (cupin superfamily)
VSGEVRGYVTGPGAGVAGFAQHVKAVAAVTAGSLTVMESTVTQGPPRHVHGREDECFYVLTGTMVVSCGDDVFEAGPGSFVFLPRGVPHTFRAAGDGQADVLFIAVPGGIEHYFAEINAAAGVEEQTRIGDKYDIRVV